MVRIFKILIAILLLAFLFWKVPVNDLVNLLENTSVDLIIYFLLISILLIYISTLKWKVFLDKENKKISILKLYNLYLVGYFVNLFIPSFVGGDVVRSFKLSSKVGKKVAYTATFLERYTGFIAMLLIAFICMWFTNKVSTNLKFFIVFLNLFALLASIVLFSNLFNFSKIKFLEKIASKILEVKSLVRKNLSNLSVILPASFLSIIFHVFTVVNTVTAAYMLGWYTVPIFELFLVLPIILTISAIPITPNGLGIQEGAFFVLLQSLGATSEVALGVALLLRLKAYFLGVIGGGLYLVEKN